MFFLSIQENVGNHPKEKRMCKRCMASLTNFHELYCLVKTNYNSFPEPSCPELFPTVIENRTEEDKLIGKDNLINSIENGIKSYNYFFSTLRDKKL